MIQPERAVVTPRVIWPETGDAVPIDEIFHRIEDTRTGFYTDKFNEQSYQTPEDIRKANLCGADLRGTRVNGVDLYLVDLQGAKYDANQLEHFRRCRAILSDQK